MKHVLLHLSLLLAFGVLVGDWQPVAETSSFESSAVENEHGTFDNNHLDELDFALLTSITVLSQVQPSRLVVTSPTSNVFSRIRGFHSIRAPPVSLA